MKIVNFRPFFDKMLAFDPLWWSEKELSPGVFVLFLNFITHISRITLILVDFSWLYWLKSPKMSKFWQKCKNASFFNNFKIPVLVYYLSLKPENRFPTFSVWNPQNRFPNNIYDRQTTFSNSFIYKTTYKSNNKWKES